MSLTLTEFEQIRRSIHSDMENVAREAATQAVAQYRASQKSVCDAHMARMDKQDETIAKLTSSMSKMRGLYLRVGVICAALGAGLMKAIDYYLGRH